MSVLPKSPDAQSAPLEDPTALARFGNLEVVARLLVEGYLIGHHKSPYKGASVEFVEHRQYYPGDEIRHIDWRAFGKTGKYYIKEFEDETNLRCYLMVDASGSMRFAQSTISKFDYARQLACALGYMLLTQRDGVGLMTFDTQVQDRLDPSTSPRTFQQVSGMLQARQPGGETSLASVMEQFLPAIKRRSLCIVFSDFFDDVDRLSAVLKRFRHARHEVVLFHVVAPEEEEFPYSKPTQFHSLEQQGKRMLVDPHRLRRLYLQRYREFCAELIKTAGSCGVDYHKIVTTEPYGKALGAYLDARASRAKRR